MRFFIFFAALILTTALNAASTNAPGYILTKDGDRIEGTHVVRTLAENEVKAIFINARGEKKTFKADDLAGYGYHLREKNENGVLTERWVHYESMTMEEAPMIFASKKVFVERLSQGDINLYCYFIEDRENTKQPYKHYYLIRNAEGAVSKVTENNFLQTAKTLFTGYKALNTRLGQQGFQYKNLGRMVNDYNYWASNGHNTDTYRVAVAGR
jgi:hypothetical protein